MSFSFRHPTSKLRRGPAPWSFWLWSGGAWVVIASAVFRGDAVAPGPALASWGPGAGVGDALIASVDQPAGSTLGSSIPQLVPPPEPVADEARTTARAVTLTERGPRWQSLRKALRQFIDREAGQTHGWGRLVVDGSGDPSGNAADLAFRTAQPGATAPASQPHFVIGNGSRSDDGRIEPTGRPLAEDDLRITLIGDLHTAPPTAAQLHGLTELIDYLRAKTGMIPVRTAVGLGLRTAVLPQEVLDVAFNQSLAASASSPMPPAAE